MKIVPEHARDIIRNAGPTSRTKGAKWLPTRPFLIHEEYSTRCLISAGELLSICEQMAIATELLSGYRSGASIRETVITRFDYLVYHIENHLIRSISVLDRSLHLTNTVFRLGMPEEDCRFDSIVRNDYVSNTNVARALKELDKLLKPFRRLRNVVIHRRRHSDQDFAEFELYYLLQKTELKERTADPLTKRYFVWYKAQTDQRVQEKKRSLGEINQKVFSEIKQLFVALEPTFVRIHGSIKDAG